MKYNYDEKGAIFSYFLLTLFTMILIPYTYHFLTFKQQIPPEELICEKSKAKAKFIAKRKKPDSRWIFLLIGWIFFAIALNRSMTLQEEAPGLWDPYHILGVDPESEERVVKKAFKKLSLIYHPDKVKPEEKETAETKFIEISKAYKVLTDEESRKKWEEFGHPDGKQAAELGLALPSWLLEKGNTGLVLLVYTIIFGIALPVIVARWWRNAKITSKNQVLNDTMGIFYRELNDNLGFKSLLEILIKAEEFQRMDFEKYDFQMLEDEVNKALDQDKFDFKTLKKVTNLQSKRTLFLLLAHACRVEVKPELQMADVIELASRLIVRGMLHIANARNWLRVSIQIIEFNQLIVQALLPHQSALLQLPFIDNEILKHFNTKKRRIETIRDLLKVSPADRRDLLRSLDEQQISLIEKVAQRYPVVEVLKAEYSVIGEEAIVPSSLVTLSIKFKCVFGLDDKNTDESIPDPEEEKKQKQWWVIKPIDKHQPYCPYFPGVKQPIFSVMLANTNIGRLICMTKVVGVDQDHVVRLQFQAPPEPGAWVFQAFIKSDTYVGADATVDCKLVVQPANVLPELVEPETESDSDEEIVGQQKPVSTRKYIPKDKRGPYDDSTDSEDEFSSDDEKS